MFTHPPSQPTIAAQLLGEPASGEPYTILVMDVCVYTNDIIILQFGRVWVTGVGRAGLSAVMWR
jgi:hypothetical protein